jgi:hypothetical protein
MNRLDLEAKIKLQTQRDVDEAVRTFRNEVVNAGLKLLARTPYGSSHGEEDVRFVAPCLKSLLGIEKGYPHELWAVRQDRIETEVLQTMNALQKLLVARADYTPENEPAAEAEKAKP